MPIVELIFDSDCPNSEIARSRLLTACNNVGWAGGWNEIVRGAGAPEYAMHFGSPTVLIDGQDVSPTDEPAASNCRIYPLATGGFDRAPGVGEIERALRESIIRRAQHNSLSDG